MDPEELEEVGLFLLLGIIMAILMKGKAGDYEPVITVVLYALFIVGIGIVVYGLVLSERMGKLLKKHEEVENEQEGGDDDLQTLQDDKGEL